MKLKELASLIAKREGKKSQARIGDIREILSILSDIRFDEGEEIDILLFKNGKKRSKNKKK